MPHHFLDSGLYPGTTVYYQVQATYGVGSPTGPSLWSAPVQVVTYPANPIWAITPPAVTDTTATLSWDVLAPAAGATSYTLDQSTNGVTWQTAIGNTSTTNRVFTVTGLTANTLYYFRVDAVNALGSSPSSPLKVVTLLLTPPSLTATTTTYNSVNLAWTSVAGATKYVFERVTTLPADPTGAWAAAPGYQTFTVDGAKVAYVDTSGITPVTTYYYHMQAQSATGQSPWSTNQTVTTYPGPATISAGYTVGNTTLSLTWTGGTGADYYNVEDSTNGTTWASVGLVPAPPPVTPYVVTGLNANTLYYFRIASLTGTNETDGPFIQITTSPLPPPSFTATTISSTEIDLAWAAVAGAAKYQIQHGLLVAGSISWSAIATLPSNANVPLTYQDLGLTPNTTYYYRILTANAAGADSDWSVVQNATTLAIPPSTPTIIGVNTDTQQLGDTYVGLTWTYAGTLAGLTGFNVLEAPAPAGFTVVGSTPPDTMQFTVTGLTAATTYYFEVASVNAGGSSPSSAMSVTTSVLPTANLYVYNMDTLAVNGIDPQTAPDNRDRLLINWAVVAGATGYELQRRDPGSAVFQDVSAIFASTQISYTDTIGINAGSKYDYRIRALNGTGYLAWSSIVTGETYPPLISDLHISLMNKQRCGWTGRLLRGRSPIV